MRASQSEPNGLTLSLVTDEGHEDSIEVARIWDQHYLGRSRPVKVA